MPNLNLAGRYIRDVAASLERVWENVSDWEHLPSLHSDVFVAAELLSEHPGGWHARILSQPGDLARAQILRLDTDRVAGSYRVTTVEGPGRGTEIFTRLTPRSPGITGIVAEFHVTETEPARLAKIGERYAETYARLWDEDEAMMIHREHALAARLIARKAVDPSPLDLGDVHEVQNSLPLIVEFGGERFRLLELDGGLVAHGAVCPHWLAPLDETSVVDGCLRCPWHGYLFDVRTGRSADDHGSRLATPPRVVLSDGHVWLEAAN